MGDAPISNAELTTLSQKVQELQKASGNHEMLSQTVGGLQQTLASLEGTVQTLSQSLEATRARLTAIDTAINERRAESARQFAILLSIDQLRAAAGTSQPFEMELNAARALARDDTDILKQLDALTPYAGDGAPTLNELRAEFSDLASEIVRSNVVGSGKSWFRQALYRLGSVVSVRRIGAKAAVQDNSAETLVARAESELEEDDLAAATATLDGLTGLPKDVAAAWTDAAGRRLAVEGALQGLAEMETSRLSTLSANPQASSQASPPAGPPAGDGAK